MILALYAILTAISIGVPMVMSRRWRQETAAEEEAEQVPYGPSRPGPGQHRAGNRRLRCRGHPLAGRRRHEPLAGGHRGRRDPDRGPRRVRAVRRGGLRRRIWDLLAGNAERGDAPRELIDESMRPVWEGNHVWLVFVLVVLWTSFPPAFAAVMTALFVPLSLSLLGIVLRGVGFAFRHTAQRLRMQQFTGATFAAP